MRSLRPDRKQGLDKLEQVTAFMAELEKTVVTVEITRATESDLRALIATHLWSADDGLRLVLGAGIGALSAERVLEAASDSEKVRQLARLLAEAEGKLAAVRFELGDAREQLKRWELSSGAIAKIAHDLEEILRRQNSEIDALKELLKEKDQEFRNLRQKGIGSAADAVG